MTKSTKVAFLGNETLATGVNSSSLIFNGLVEAGYDITLLVINQAEITSRRTRLNSNVEDNAQMHGIKISQNKDYSQIAKDIRQSQAELGVLVAYGRLVPQSIIDAFPAGIINVHPSLLPKYRGSSPIEQAILDGTTQTGVSLIKLVEKMDAGPIIACRSIEIVPFATKQELADQCSRAGLNLLLQSLPSAVSTEAIDTSWAQDDNLATFTKRIKVGDSKIDWSKTAIELERHVRAYSGWPGSKAILQGKPVKIIKSHFDDAKGKPGEIYHDKNRLGVFCGQGSLIIDHLQPEGKSMMSGADFVRGYVSASSSGT